MATREEVLELTAALTEAEPQSINALNSLMENHTFTPGENMELLKAIRLIQCQGQYCRQMMEAILRSDDELEKIKERINKYTTE